MTYQPKSYFITNPDFTQFVNQMIKSKKVVAPVAKETQFVFAPLEKFEDLRLDYDVTVLPPKKEFFPPAQVLLEFDGKGFKSVLHPEEKILFGVHFYDIKAIDQLDILFASGHPDENYLAHRRAATIVGSNIQKISPRAFWGSVGPEQSPKGHDAFLTKINNGYVYEVFSPRGEVLTKLGQFSSASDEQKMQAKQINEKILNECPEKLPGTSAQIKEKVRNAFRNDALWEKLATDCFSCGSCNTTCSTCYCFDVQDHWNVDMSSGQRVRYWDSCLTEDFAKISLGGGATENFRHSRGSRFRHRMMRKFVYLNDKLGGPACVGCGRCSSSCTANISDPVHVIQQIFDAEGGKS